MKWGGADSRLNKCFTDLELLITGPLNCHTEILYLKCVRAFGVGQPKITHTNSIRFRATKAEYGPRA
jgi:hypothetical protein